MACVKVVAPRRVHFWSTPLRHARAGGRMHTSFVIEVERREAELAQLREAAREARSIVLVPLFVREARELALLDRHELSERAKRTREEDPTASKSRNTALDVADRKAAHQMLLGPLRIWWRQRSHRTQLLTANVPDADASRFVTGHKHALALHRGARHLVLVRRLTFVLRGVVHQLGRLIQKPRLWPKRSEQERSVGNAGKRWARNAVVARWSGNRRTPCEDIRDQSAQAVAVGLRWRSTRAEAIQTLANVTYVTYVTIQPLANVTYESSGGLFALRFVWRRRTIVRITSR